MPSDKTRTADRDTKLLTGSNAATPFERPPRWPAMLAAASIAGTAERRVTTLGATNGSNDIEFGPRGWRRTSLRWGRLLKICLERSAPSGVTVDSLIEFTPMPFTLKPLPYEKSALSPTISTSTMELHYEKHHRGYVEKLNKLTAGTSMAQMPLDRVVERAWGNPNSSSIFDHAAQIWNHDFFWQSMSPKGGFRAIGRLRSRIDAAFGSYENFEDRFVEHALAQFGSGWAWLVVDDGQLKVMTTGDAITPIVLGRRPLLTCDLWEHAYYLDYQNDRERFVRTFLSRLANWEFAAQQLEATQRLEAARVVRPGAQPTHGARIEATRLPGGA